VTSSRAAQEGWERIFNGHVQAHSDHREEALPMTSRTLRSMPASASAEVATAVGLDERYGREWLAATTVGGSSFTTLRR
jgi:hypothetical protein